MYFEQLSDKAKKHVVDKYSKMLIDENDWWIDLVDDLV